MCIGLGEHSAVLDAFRGDRKNGKPWTTWARHGLLGDDCPRGTRHGRRLESQSIQYEYILDRFFMWHSCGGYCTSKVPSGKLPPTLTSLYEYCTSTVQLQYSMKVLGSCTLRVTPHMLLTCSDRSERRSQREEIVRSG
jgi:hypothetical protein